MNFKRTVGPKGQVVIPRDVRQFLGVEPGSDITFEVREKEAVIKRSGAPSDAVDEYVSVVAPKLKTKVQVEQIVEEEILEETAVR